MKCKRKTENAIKNSGIIIVTWIQTKVYEPTELFDKFWA